MRLYVVTVVCKRNSQQTLSISLEKHLFILIRSNENIPKLRMAIVCY